MRFHANFVSGSEDGDYYQIWLDTKDSAKEAADPQEIDSPYVIVQRDFGMPDGGRCNRCFTIPIAATALPLRGSVQPRFIPRRTAGVFP